MSLKPTRTSYWGELIERGAPSVHGGSQLVRAFNNMDVDLVAEALKKHPDCWKTLMTWNKDGNINSQFDGGHTAMGAAVRMGWSAVLPVLWEAGARGHGVGARNALAAATKHREAACVRKLFDLGMDPNGTPDTRPYSYLLQHHVDPSKNPAQARIAKAYFAKGMDPWANIQSSRQPKWALVQEMMHNHSVVPLRDLLQYAAKSKQLPAAEHQKDPTWFWNLFSQTLTEIMAHPYEGWRMCRPIFSDIVRAAHELGLPASTGDVQHAANKVINHIEKDGAGRRGEMLLVEWMEICKVFLSLSKDPAALHTAITHKLLAHPTLTCSVVSQWVEAELDRNTVAPMTAARPKMRL